MQRKTQTFAILALLLPILLLIGCDTDDSSSATSAAASGELIGEFEGDQGIKGQEGFVPTIYPTRTASPTATLVSPPATSTPNPTVTPIDYQQTAVNLSYQIPGIGLDRRISANISSQVEVTDATTNQVVNLSNQPQVLIELQQVLKDIELEPIQNDCSMCVRLEYELPMAGKSGVGWLQDRRLLASLENYTAALLGAHYPEGTLIGLRRTATLFHPAHTIAVTEDGQIWHWKANESSVQSPSDYSDEFFPLLQAIEQLEPENLRERYVISCPQGPGFEELFLAGDEEDTNIRLTCPELTLPSSLMTIYVTLDGLVNELIELDQSDSPEPLVPLSALLYFERDDGLNLTVFQDNSVTLIADQGQIFTGTISNTVVLSLTNQLVESELVQPGMVDILQETYTNNIFLRGEEDVYETGWLDSINPELADFIAWINELILQIQFGPPEEEANSDTELTPTPAPTEESTS